jgi:hypothetical protein
MDKKNDQIAHRKIVAGREILRKYGKTTIRQPQELPTACGKQSCQSPRLQSTPRGSPCLCTKARPSSTNSSNASRNKLANQNSAARRAIVPNPKNRTSRTGSGSHSGSHLRSRLGRRFLDSHPATESTRWTTDSPAFGILFRLLSWSAPYGSPTTRDAKFRCFRNGISEFRMGSLQSSKLPYNKCIDHDG